MNRNLIAGLIALILVGGAGAGFMLTRGDDENTNTANQTTTQATSDEKSEQAAGSNVDLPKQTVGNQPDCSLYTLEDIAGIWGVPMTDTDVDGSKVTEISGPQNYQYECDYNETDSGSGLSIIINFKVYENKSAAKNEMENIRSTVSFGEEVYFILDEISDLGEEAFFFTSNREAISNREDQMYVRDGNVVYLMTAVNLDGKQPDYKEKLVETFKLRLE